MAQDKLHIFQRLVPNTAAEYCLSLWEQNKFKFIITKPRSSKFGDFRFNPTDLSYQITVNGNLNKFAFLLTYLHEVAHLIAHKKYGNKILPHGKEWKTTFQLLLSPIANKETFPLDILLELEGYIENPKATSCSDPDLMMVLQKYDTRPTGSIHLEHVPTDGVFMFQNRVFKKLESRRTRIVSLEISSQKRYLISKIALVILIEKKEP